MVLLEEILDTVASLAGDKSLIDIDLMLSLSHSILDGPNSITQMFTYRDQAITALCTPGTIMLILCAVSSGSSSTRCCTLRGTARISTSTWSWPASRTYTWAYLPRTPHNTAHYTAQTQTTSSPPPISHSSYKYCTWSSAQYTDETGPPQKLCSTLRKSARYRSARRCPPGNCAKNCWGQDIVHSWSR